MQILEKALFRINLRPVYKGRTLCPHMRRLNGVELKLRCIGTQGVADKYPGEMMLAPVSSSDRKLFDAHTISWLASGDVEKVE